MNQQAPLIGNNYASQTVGDRVKSWISPQNALEKKISSKVELSNIMLELYRKTFLSAIAKMLILIILKVQKMGL